MAGTVAWISTAPVKGMRIQAGDRVELGPEGVPGDRAFFVVDERRAMISSVRIGSLLEIVPEHEPESGLLRLGFPGGERVEERVELGRPEPVTVRGATLRARPVMGPFSEAISRHCGLPLRLMARPEGQPMVDRGREGAVTLLGTGSLRRLRAAGESFERRPGLGAEGAAGLAAPGGIDRRRFRMTFGVDGIEPHEEDLWVGGEVSIGGAVVQVADLVGRCALTTRDPESGRTDLRTLHYLESYRGDLPSGEPLPFGVFAAVREPGEVKLGDPVERR